MAHYGKSASAAILTHLRRELAQAIWMLLLDDDFMHAYIHGVLFRLADGIMQLFFPLFLVYSSDYPEKSVQNPLLPRSMLNLILEC
jgi:hypothetical protein